MDLNKQEHLKRAILIATIVRGLASYITRRRGRALPRPFFAVCVNLVRIFMSACCVKQCIVSLFSVII